MKEVLILMNLTQEKQSIHKIQQGLDSILEEISDEDYKSAKIIAHNLFKNGIDFASNSQNLKISQEAYESDKGLIKHGYLIRFRNLYFIVLNLIITEQNRDKINKEKPGVDLTIPYKGIDMADDCRAFQFASKGHFYRMIDNIKKQVERQIKTVENDLHNILTEIDHKENKDSKMQPIANGSSLQTTPREFMKYNAHLMMVGMQLASVQQQPNYTEDKGIKFLADNHVFVDNMKQFANATQLP